MFESVEVGEKLDKATFEEKAPRIRSALLDVQARLKESEFSVVIVIAGAAGAGKGEAVNFLHNWLDVRFVETNAIGAPSEEEIERPIPFRFWRRLPPKGKFSIFFGSWYTQPIVDRIDDKIDVDTFDRKMHKIVEFERMLVSENTILQKFWLHITKKQQRKRFKHLEKNPDTSWRVTPDDWKKHKTYDRFIEVSSRALRQTSSGHAAWELVEAADKRYRNLTVAQTLIANISRRLDALKPPKPKPLPLPSPPKKNIINSLNQTQLLHRKDYSRLLKSLQGKIGRLSREMTKVNCSGVLVFEGSDAAGKGGCIRRVVQALDARFYHVIPVAAPTDEESARPYLWRFWRTLPRRGRLCIYDRSWYGRVLVERLEGFCKPEDWRRGFAEINAFEEELSEFGMMVTKFWLSITKEEQLKRFEHRKTTGYKRHKITEEDWRNREKWDAYEAAACDMIKRTSTEIAPWNLIEANDKLFARIKVLKVVCQQLEAMIEKHSTSPKRKNK